MGVKAGRRLLRLRRGRYRKAASIMASALSRALSTLTTFMRRYSPPWESLLHVGFGRAE